MIDGEDAYGFLKPDTDFKVYAPSNNYNMETVIELDEHKYLVGVVKQM